MKRKIELSLTILQAKIVGDALLMYAKPVTRPDEANELARLLRDMARQVSPNPNNRTRDMLWSYANSISSSIPSWWIDQKVELARKSLDELAMLDNTEDDDAH